VSRRPEHRPGRSAPSTSAPRELPAQKASAAQAAVELRELPAGEPKRRASPLAAIVAVPAPGARAAHQLPVRERTPRELPASRRRASPLAAIVTPAAVELLVLHGAPSASGPGEPARRA
jgi:hypothetical protein